jgi:hypothetical protein
MIFLVTKFRVCAGYDVDMLLFSFPEDFFLMQCDCQEVLIAIALIANYTAVVVNAADIDIFNFSRMTEVSCCIELGVDLDFCCSC